VRGRRLSSRACRREFRGSYLTQGTLLQGSRGFRREGEGDTMGKRALWKGPWSVVEYTAKKVFSRGSMVLPGHVGNTYEIHNGKA